MFFYLHCFVAVVVVDRLMFFFILLFCLLFAFSLSLSLRYVILSTLFFFSSFLSSQLGLGLCKTCKHKISYRISISSYSYHLLFSFFFSLSNGCQTQIFVPHMHTTIIVSLSIYAQPSRYPTRIDVNLHAKQSILTRHFVLLN